jgi:hypothetical protein
MSHVREKYEKYYPYLEDVRQRLYKGVILFVVSFIVGFFQTSTILKLFGLQRVATSLITNAASPVMLVPVVAM